MRRSGNEHMFIRMVGQYVTVALNDKTVVENEIFENYFDHSRPIFMRGPIYLQTHGAETRFRNIFIRELSPSESHEQLAKMRSEDGFQSLFNGHDLSDWMGAVGDYDVADRAIVCRPGREGNLVTKDMYDNFVARLEFKLPPGGNNGLAIRTPTPKAVATYEGWNYKSLIIGRHNTLASNPPISRQRVRAGSAVRGYFRLPVSGTMKK